MYKPNLERMMREIVDLDVVNPLAWARTFEASNITAEMVEEAVEHERMRRDEIGKDVVDQAIIRNREETVDE